MTETFVHRTKVGTSGPMAQNGLEHVVLGNVTALADLSAAGTSFALMDVLAGCLKFKRKAEVKELETR